MYCGDGAVADPDRLGELLLRSPTHVSKCQLSLSSALKVLAHAMTGVASTTASDGKEKLGLLAGHVQLDGEMKTVVVTEVRVVLAQRLHDQVVFVFPPLSLSLALALALSLSLSLSLALSLPHTQHGHATHLHPATTGLSASGDVCRRWRDRSRCEDHEPFLRADGPGGSGAAG